MYEQEKAQIRLLQGKLDDLRYVEQTKEIKALEDELREKIRDLKLSLPAGDPLTKPGPRGDGTRVSDYVFRSLGEQAQAIARAAMPGREVDQRLYSIRAALGLSETVPSEGGFMLQSDFSTALITSAYEGAPVASRCNHIPISVGANSIKLPMVDETSRATGCRWGGVQSYWLQEAGDKTPSKPKFRLCELILKKLIGVCYATDELLQDATALDAVLRQAFSEEISFMVDDAIINGTGAGMPLGILAPAGCLVSVTGETGQKPGTVVWENVVKMFSRMPGRNRRNAVWFINQAVEPQLYSMSLSVGTGGIPVFMPAGGASAAPYASLFGRPIIPIEQCAALGTLGDIFFMDPSAYILIDKGGVQTDVSIHVEFLSDQSTFRFVYRCDGQPSWAAPLTPYKGAATLSPFVALATR